MGKWGSARLYRHQTAVSQRLVYRVEGSHWDVDWVARCLKLIWYKVAAGRMLFGWSLTVLLRGDPPAQNVWLRMSRD